ncbi:SlyX protein [Marinobacter sp. 3-2]|jgi:SlyX protein|nr:SlyX family protein [Marinobacter sp. 3-2]ROQ39268.1 SlyX protein [Marinobacter sp. 3-2]
MSQNDLETRLDELETRLAFQDDVINTLSEQVAKQEMDIRELWEAKRLLHKQLKDVSPSNIKSEQDETPPPHYCKWRIKKGSDEGFI